MDGEGEKARLEKGVDVASSASSDVWDIADENAELRYLGAGMLLGVFGRALGVALSPNAEPALEPGLDGGEYVLLPFDMRRTGVNGRALDRGGTGGG